MEENHLPQPITNMEIIMDFRLKQLVKEQQKTNELLISLVEALQPKPKAKTKSNKKEGEE